MRARRRPQKGMASPRWPSPAQSCACCSRNASAHPPTRVSAGKRACKNIAPSAGALACVFILLEPAQRASATITCLQAMLANKAARPCNRVTFAIISAARAGAADASATSAAAFPIRHETPLRRHERPAVQRKPQQSIRISPFTKRKSGVNEKGGGTGVGVAAFVVGGFSLAERVMPAVRGRRLPAGQAARRQLRGWRLSRTRTA